MSRRAGRLGGAISLLGLAALIAAGLATAGSPPAPIGPAKPGKVRLVGQNDPKTALPAGKVHAIGYRLAAKLTPASSTSSASGHWDGVLIHTIGTVQNGTMPSIPGCTVTGPKVGGGPGQSPPRSSGLPYRIKCNGPVPSIAVPGTGQHWILGWRLSYSNLSSAVTGTDLRLNVPGTASALASTLCGPCTSGKFGRTTLTADQAVAILKGYGSVVVRTANNAGGEISGQILRVTTP
jgi:hypothetical protein